MAPANGKRTSRSPKPKGKPAADGPVWTLDAAGAVAKMKTDLTSGLTSQRVEELRAEHGWNELEKEEERSFWEMVLEQFDDPLVKILLVAACVSTGIAVYEAYEEGVKLTIDRFVEPLVIVLILVLNAAIGVFQESSAEASLEALKEMQPTVCTVLRDGEWKPHHEAKDLVPGDVIKLIVGDRVPADARVVKLLSTTMRTEQMALTGESVAVQKQSEAVSHTAEDLEIQLKMNMVFAGTTVAAGTSVCVVTGTGMKTEIGKIQDQIKQAEEQTREEKTPLKQKLDEFSDQLQNLITGVCVLVWLINIRQFVSLDWTAKPLPLAVDVRRALFYFQIAVSLAVAAIPEGLPTVITMCLALGTRKMAKRNCIVRQLPAVETLGCTTVICSDKTGTLTTNMMTCRRVVLGTTTSIEVTGSSYDPKDGAASSTTSSKSLQLLTEICVLCNDSDVVYVDPEASEGQLKHVGAPTEAALKVLVEKLVPTKSSSGSKKVVLPATQKIKARFEHVATLEFTRDRKSMSVIAREGKETSLLVKGAPESVLERCTQLLDAETGKIKKLTASDREALLKAVSDMSVAAWRCLGFAYKSLNGTELETYNGESAHKAHKELSDPENFEHVESDLIWVGSVGMQDPPRAEVKGAIAACRQAGIRVMVITGDNKLTAEAIAKDIGILAEDSDVEACSFVGSDFTRMSLADQRAALWNPRAPSLVFSRAEPKFKQEIVALLKQGPNGDSQDGTGEIVAMTGDGINDAPALKMADIGVAMGIAGTEVAKGAADMVLADDDFSTIVAAIEEGRSIYANMRAFIRYMISSNLGEVASIFLTAALGFPEGIISVQLLWVNLVTDGPPATALGFNKAEPGVMNRPPRSANEPLIGRWASFRFLVVGAYVGLATVGIFAAWFTQANFMGIDLSQDGHVPVTLEQLMNWPKCNTTSHEFVLPSGTIKDFRTHVRPWTAVSPLADASTQAHPEWVGCEVFGRQGKMKASTLSLTVLVIIEMMNACNALSEDSSLLRVTPLSNPYLLLAIFASVFVHLAILYVPFLSPYFDVVPLSWNEWKLVLLFSGPVVVIDEILKIVARANRAAQKKRELSALADLKATAKTGAKPKAARRGRKKSE